MVGDVSTYLNPNVGRIKQYPDKLPGENKVFSKIRMFFICSILWLMTPSAFGQSNHFARLSVSPKEVITGQPFFVKIIVYTPTWFTKAPDFGEYQVNNSFTIRNERPLGGYETINGKRYTTLSYEYIVFPLKAGKLELPPLSVEFESPVEGDYKGKPVTVSTTGASIEILPIPDYDNSKPLFVANNVTISENWNKEFSGLKVGDVLERTLRISANGTLANIIPPVAFDSLAWASTYLGKAILSQSINGKTVISERIEKHTYLLEQEGSYVIPEIQLNYYNLKSRKWVLKSFPAKDITAADNPDLYMLKTLQDSLAMGENTFLEGEKRSTHIFGLSIERFLSLVAIYCVSIAVIIFLLRKVLAWYKAYRTSYLESERYQFNQLIRAIRNQNPKQINDQLYQWLRKLDVKHPIISIYALVNVIENNELAETVNAFHKHEFGNFSKNENEISDKNLMASLENHLKSARRRWFQLQQEQEQVNYNFNI
jgi:hypothetical protein